MKTDDPGVVRFRPGSVVGYDYRKGGKSVTGAVGLAFVKRLVADGNEQVLADA